MSERRTRPAIVFVLSAPSGAGKTTLAAELLRRADGLERTVSCTTRPRRPWEVEGRDYRFLTQEEFTRLRDRGEFLETAEVHGNLYGTPRSELERIGARGHDALLVIDVQGAAQVRERLEGAVTIFVLPPSRRALEERLQRRSGEDPAEQETIRRRLGGAAEEIDRYLGYDYLVVNDELEPAVRELEAIVVAERCRSARRRRQAQTILESFRGARVTRSEDHERERDA